MQSTVPHIPYPHVPLPCLPPSRSIAEVRAEPILSETIVSLQSSGIEYTAGNITAWRNGGTGGSNYDLTSIVGSPTLGSYGGERAISLNGSSGLKPAAQRTVAHPWTICLVSVWESLSAGVSIFPCDSFGTTGRAGFWKNATEQWLCNLSNGNMTFSGNLVLGKEVTLISHASGGAISYGESLQRGSTSGTIAQQAFLYATVGCRNNNISGINGLILGYYVWNRNLSQAEARLVINAL